MSRSHRPPTAAAGLSPADMLGVLDLIRIANGRITQHKAAASAHRRATGNAVSAKAAHDELARRYRRFAVSCADAAREAQAEALTAAWDTYEKARTKERKAAEKRLRALRALPAAARGWRKQMARLGQTVGDREGRRPVTRRLLDELADDPVALIRAADAVIVQSSAGKDSVVALAKTVAAAKAAGCLEKVVVVHCDLGQAEWPGVRDLAQRQAERYGVKFRVVADEGGFLGMVERRGMWPDAQNRLCTSKLKRDKAGPVITAIVDALGLGHQAVILNVMGVRAGESANRALKRRLDIDPRLANGKRLVLTWNAVFELSESDVWQEIADQGLEYHPCYDAGLERLSCVYCVLAGLDWLVLATRVAFALNLPHPELYVDLERRIGHTFKNGVTLGGIVAAARMLDALDGPITWTRGDALRRHLGDAAANAYLARTEPAAPALAPVDEVADQPEHEGEPADGPDFMDLLALL